MCVQIDQKTCLSETISGGRPTFNKAIKPKNSQEIVCVFKELNHPTHTPFPSKNRGIYSTV